MAIHRSSGHSDGSTWTSLDQPSVTSLSSVSCSVGSTLRRCRASPRVAVHVSEHNEWRQLVDLYHFDSSWQTTEAISCLRTETTCIAVGTNLSSTPYVIGTSNNGATWSAQIPPPNAVDLTGISCSDRSGLHRRRKQRQHGSRINHHGNNDWRIVLGGAESAVRY